MMNTQTIQDPSQDILVDGVPWIHGKISEALVDLLRMDHEHTLWRAIGFEPIPSDAQINFNEIAVPF